MQHTIQIYDTHIEVTPYQKGDSPELELLLSRKDKPTHSLIPIGYWCDEETETLYLPRGVDIPQLEYIFRTKAETVRTRRKVVSLKKGHMLGKPRDDLQRNAIDFLLQTGDYKNALNINQLGLNMPTGTGKTYCTIHALIKGKSRAMIICHTEKVRDQWIRGFEKHTSISSDRVLIVSGSKLIEDIIEGRMNPLDYDYFVGLHQSFTSYASQYSWKKLQEFFDKIQVQTKVIDEAHLYFQNILMIDYFSNIPLTYYVTATFGRSDYQENQIYEIAYSHMLRFGDDVQREKHTLVFVVLTDSHPTTSSRIKVDRANAYGFSVANYMNYEIEESTVLEDMIELALTKTQRLEGKTMIISNLRKSVEETSTYAKQICPDDQVVFIHSNSEAGLDAIDDADIICATSKLIGTGGDIKGLRVLISAEPMGSPINIKQLLGRLRPYIGEDGEQKDTVFFYLMDMGFEGTRLKYSRIEKTLRELSKKMFIVDLR